MMLHIKELVQIRLNVRSLVIICLTLFLLSTSIQTDARENVAKEYNKLIQTYEEYIRLEEDVFKDLVFTLSDFQFRKGQTLKLILEDQLGRKWMFKFGEPTRKGARVVYCLFKLFGLNTPEIHYKTLNINGRMIPGSIQRFIPHRGTLRDVNPTELPQDCLDYLLKTHIFYWLIANLDAHSSNFIIIGNDKNKDVLRVDNRVWWHLLDSQELKYDYFPPWASDPSWSCYYNFWKDYMSNKISLPLKKNYEFIMFISDFLEEFFIKLFYSELKNIKYISKKLDIIIKRKHNLPEDFAVFYDDLLSKRGESIKFSKDVSYQKISNSICKGLESEIHRLKDEKLKLKKTPKKQKEIKAVVSYDAYRVVLNIYMLYWGGEIEETGKSLFELCDDALEELYMLESSTTNKLEKEAIECYIEEVKRIKSSGEPSWGFTELSKIIDVIPKE